MKDYAFLKIADLDADGQKEIILRNRHLYAVFSPGQGGRLIYLFSRTARGGALVVGNPTDDWNFQEELNRYMDRPANHPGGLADVGFEHDRYWISVAEADDYAFVEMTNTQSGSPMFGARKSILLPARAPILSICYRIPERLEDFATEICLSPDYYSLLRTGRRALSPIEGQGWCGFRNGDAAVWLGLAQDEATFWPSPASTEVGHGVNVRVGASTSHFHLLLGCGETDDESCRRFIRMGRDAMHREKPVKERPGIKALEVNE